MAGETLKTLGIVLSIRPWSQTSHVVTWLTLNGVITTLVKGALRPKSAFIGQYDLFYTCELVYYLLLQQPEVNGKAQNLPFQTLYSLTTGLLTDTNNFNNSTTPATFRMAADVCEQGIDLDEITGRLYRSSRPNRLDLMGYLLNERRLRFPELGAEIMTFSLADQKKFDYLSGESEGFVNLPLQTKQVHLSGLFTETTEGYVRVSLRSKRGFSANRLAQQYFNGGGHENAAGGRLYLPIQEVPAYFENAVRAFMEQSENRAQVL
jgi:phosphoesterase RecJ-like protein